MNRSEHFDAGSLLVMAITLVLFLIALFTTGFTHDLLLEAGVFLVSVKLILIGHRNHVSNGAIQRKLEEVLSAIQQLVPLCAPQPTVPPSDGRKPSASLFGESLGTADRLAKDKTLG